MISITLLGSSIQANLPGKIITGNFTGRHSVHFQVDPQLNCLTVVFAATRQQERPPVVTNIVNILNVLLKLFYNAFRAFDQYIFYQFSIYFLYKS
jgi:hypothetical protein